MFINDIPKLIDRAADTEKRALVTEDNVLVLWARTRKLGEEINTINGRIDKIEDILNGLIGISQNFVRYAIEPLYISSQTISLRINGFNLAVDGGSLDTIQDINVASTPTFRTCILTNLTPNRIVRTDDSNQELVSVLDLTAFIGGSRNQIKVTDGGQGNVNLSLEDGFLYGTGTATVTKDSNGRYNIHTVGGGGGTSDHNSLTGLQGGIANQYYHLTQAQFSGLGALGAANQLLGMNAIGTANEYKTLAGTANRVTVTHGVGTITVSAPQNIHTGASPQFVGLTLTGNLTMGTGNWFGLSAVGVRFSWDGPSNEINCHATLDMNSNDISNGGNIHANAGKLYADTQTAKAMVYLDATNGLTSFAAATNGQIVIGSTGAIPVLANLTATANQTTVTDGAGSITIGTVQDIAIGSSPTFVGMTLTTYAAWGLSPVAYFDSVTGAITADGSFVYDPSTYFLGLGVGNPAYSLTIGDNGTDPAIIRVYGNWSGSNSAQLSLESAPGQLINVVCSDGVATWDIGLNTYLADDSFFIETATVNTGRTFNIASATGIVNMTKFGIYDSNAAFMSYFSGGVQAADINYILPTTVGGGGILTSTIVGPDAVLSWGATAPATPHPLLGTEHNDTLADIVTDGDIIIGNVTPKWSSLAISIPAANIRNVLGVDNGELRPSWKASLDATLPATIAVGGAGTAGTSLIFSHRDHNHPAPATWTPASHDLDSTTAHAIGALTSTYFPYILTNKLVNSVMTQLGGYIGIGVVAPAPLYLLHVRAADGISDNTYMAYFSNEEATVNRNNGLWIHAGSSASDYNIRCDSVGSAALWSVSGSGVFTINSLTANTVIYSNASSALVSLANAAGYLTNNGAGALSWSATATATAHNMLSAIHGDTTVGSPVVGDLVVGIAGPSWSKLADVAVGSVLVSAGVGTALSWATAHDTDYTAVLGRAAIGYDGTTADHATFSHHDFNTSTNFGFGQSGLGNTYINTITGKQIFFGINGTMFANVSASGFAMGTTSASASMLELYSSTAHVGLTITGAHATDYDPQIAFKTGAVPAVTHSLGVDATTNTFRIYHGTGVGTVGGFNMSTVGDIGVGIAPVANTALRVDYNRTDTNCLPIYSTANMICTTATARYGYNLYFEQHARVSNGVTNGGAIKGFVGYATIASTSHLGKLNYIYAGHLQYGIETSGASGTVGTVFGLLLTGFMAKQIDTYYDICISPNDYTVTPTTAWSIYNGSQFKSYYLSTIKLGATTARSVTEGTKALYLFDGTAPVGTLANGVSLYSTSGALACMDSTGIETILNEAGDTYWKGDGSGIPYGSCYGNEVAWAQAAAAGTWYNIADADMADGSGGLNLMTHDGSGKITVTKAGRYKIDYSVSAACSGANKHIETGIEISGSGSAVSDGQCSWYPQTANAEGVMGSTAILDLAASATIEIAIRCVDAGTPDLGVNHLNVSVTQCGGT